MRCLDRQTYNYGLAILKIWMSFEVVLSHFWACDNVNILLKPFVLTRTWAVPCFVLSTFFLLDNKIEEKKYINKRIYRLAIPQVLWTIIYFCGVLVLDNIAGLQSITVSDLIFQLFMGHSSNINPSMWYQVDLIITTIIVYIVNTISKKINISKIYLFIFLLFICIVFQYSDLNFNLFSTLRYELKYPLGRLAEIIPFACIGTIIAHSFNKYFGKINIYIFETINLVIVIILLFLNSIGIILNSKGFLYSGIYLIFVSTLLFLAFIRFRMPNIFRFEIIIKKIVSFIAKYTLGIYCIHRLVAMYLNQFLFKNAVVEYQNSFFECSIIFALSLFFISIYLFYSSSICQINSYVNNAL